MLVTDKIHTAAENGLFPIVESLIEEGFEYDFLFVMKKAIEHDELDFIKTMFSKGYVKRWTGAKWILIGYAESHNPKIGKYLESKPAFNLEYGDEPS